MKDQTLKLPIETIAEKLNTTPLNVLMHIKRGMLEGHEKDGAWLVECASLAALAPRYSFSVVRWGRCSDKD